MKKLLIFKVFLLVSIQGFTQDQIVKTVASDEFNSLIYSETVDYYYFVEAPGVEIHYGYNIWRGDYLTSLNDETIMYSQMKSFLPWLKSCKEEDIFPKSSRKITVSIKANLDGTLFAINMRYPGRLPIPFEACVAFREKMLKAPLKVVYEKGNPVFEGANYILTMERWRPKDLIEKIEAAP